VAWGYDIWEFRGEGEDCGSSLVSSSECNTVSLGVPFDCCDFEISMLVERAADSRLVTFRVTSY